MTKRPKILLLIPHLGGGGAEKVISLLACGLSPDQFEVHLGLITQRDPVPQELLLRMQVHMLRGRRVRSAALRLLKLVWRVRPNVILSGIAHLNFLVLLLKPFFPRGTKVIIRQNGTASLSLAFDALPPYTRFLYRQLYRNADRVICSTSAMAEDLAAVAGLENELLTVLPNPLDRKAIEAARSGPSRWQSHGPNLLAMGRLSREKGFDLLMEALPELVAEFPSAHLTILGSGAEETALKAQCSALGLEPVVTFAGYEEQPYSYFPEATLLVLPSRHEGMPNALLEALSAGLPVVATPASEGIVELLQDRPGSWLVPEVSSRALATALSHALHRLWSARETASE